MQLTWFIVGLLTGLSIFLYNELWRCYRIKWLGWTGLAVGELAVLFCIAWSVASLLEGEPRAASMGLMLFGGAGLVILVVTWRFCIQNAVRKADA